VRAGNYNPQGGEPMDAAKITKQMIDFQKTTFDNTFNAMVMLQDQAERMSKTLLEQATWLPEEGRKAIRDWVDAYKNGREEFKKHVDDNFKKVEEFFETTAKGKTSKTK
jgi:gas vesicle protein